MSSDEIDKFFKAKYGYIDDLIRNSDSVSNTLGLPSTDKAMMILHSNVLRNIKDLYFMDEITMQAVYNIRNELSKIRKQAGMTEETATQLKGRFDTTLGSLEARLKEITEKDEEERKKLGDIPFYG